MAEALTGLAMIAIEATYVPHSRRTEPSGIRERRDRPGQNLRGTSSEHSGPCPSTAVPPDAGLWAARPACELENPCGPSEWRACRPPDRRRCRCRCHCHCRTEFCFTLHRCAGSSLCPTTCTFWRRTGTTPSSRIAVAAASGTFGYGSVFRPTSACPEQWATLWFMNT